MRSTGDRFAYINMVFGAVGFLLLFVGLLEMSFFEEMQVQEFLVIIGIIIIVQYMFHLERKAGISNKAIWIKSLLLIIISFCVYYFGYR